MQVSHNLGEGEGSRWIIRVSENINIDSDCKSVFGSNMNVIFYLRFASDGGSPSFLNKDTESRRILLNTYD